MKTFKITFDNGMVDRVNAEGIIDAISDAIARNPTYSVSEIVKAEEI